MIENYNFFVDKVCTILTTPVAIPIKDPFSASQYFTGQVTKVDETGIWIKHLPTGNMGYFSFPIVGIVQEQYVPQNDPNHDKIKEEILKQKNPAPKILPNNFTSVSDLTKMAKDLKKNKE